MKLNCDMGESFGTWKIGLDEQVMPWVDMANIACGFHASDPDIMSKTVKMAVEHGVSIGAHPGYEDKSGFGRRSIPHTSEQITHLVAYQVGAIQAICQLHNTQIDYVKPHGALYNDMMANEAIYLSIVKAVSKLSVGEDNDTPKLMILAKADNTQYQKIADDHGVELLFEAFADRAYTPEGSLAPRSQPNSVFHDPEQIIAQVLKLAASGEVVTTDGETLALKPDTVCVHGDNPESVAVIQKLAEAINVK